MRKRIRVNLKPKNPFPSIPGIVRKAAISYKKTGEKENILPERAIVSGTVYNCVIYFRGRLDSDENAEGYLIVRKDGTVPPFSEAEKPLRMINSTDAMFREILLQGLQYANRPTYNWEELERLLKWIRSLLKESLPPEVQEAFDVFLSIPRRVLEKQQEIREIVLTAEKMYQQMTVDYLITEEFFQTLQSHFFRYIECLFIQHDLQVSTYHEREKFLRYLSTRVSVARFPLWWCYHRLKKHHRAMTITNKEDLEAHEDVRNDMRREKNTEKIFEWVFARTRNPRDGEKSAGK